MLDARCSWRRLALQWRKLSHLHGDPRSESEPSSTREHREASDADEHERLAARLRASINEPIFFSPAQLDIRRVRDGLGRTLSECVRDKRALLYGYIRLEHSDVARSFVNAFRANPGVALLSGLEMVVAASAEGQRVLIQDSDNILCNEFEELASSIQKITSGCMRKLHGRADLVDGLLTSKSGAMAVDLAIRASCLDFLSVPEVQQHLERQWLGEIRPNELLLEDTSPGSRSPRSPANSCRADVSTPSAMFGNAVTRAAAVTSDMILSPPPSPPGAPLHTTPSGAEADSAAPGVSGPSRVLELALRDARTSLTANISKFLLGNKWTRLPLSVLVCPLVALWPPLDDVGRSSPKNSLSRIFYLPPSARFWLFELSNLAFVTCRTVLPSTVKRGEPDPERDWFMLVWAVAQAAKICEFIFCAGLFKFFTDPHNWIEMLTTILTLATNVLAICNYVDWPHGSAGSDSAGTFDETELARRMLRRTGSSSVSMIDTETLVMPSSSPLDINASQSLNFGSVFTYCPRNLVAPLAAQVRRCLPLRTIPCACTCARGCLFNLVNRVLPLGRQELMALAIWLRWLNLIPRMLQRTLSFGPLLMSAPHPYRIPAACSTCT